MGSRFLESLLKVSEKAANIARVIRQDEHLFRLLVQEKKGKEKNERFVQDFKTLADVLIQETVKHDIGSQQISWMLLSNQPAVGQASSPYSPEGLPAIAEHIMGEENNTFSNTLGDTITISVQPDEQATAELLNTVLGGDKIAAELLAAEVHRALDTVEVDVGRSLEELPQIGLPLDSCGIWIDPIDSTGEYISGVEAESPVKNIYQSGLHCVTVLIGVFDLKSGQPLMGVVNQPFHMKIEDRWTGKCFWGLKYNDNVHYSTSCTDTYSCTHSSSTRVVVLSSSESEELKLQLQAAGYAVAEAAGAGYKLLCVACGLADVYVLSKASTFAWDTCGPHAILRSLGGGLVKYSSAVTQDTNLQDSEVSYLGAEKVCNSNRTTVCCNAEGIIACRDTSVMLDIVQLVKALKG